MIADSIDILMLESIVKVACGLQLMTENGLIVATQYTAGPKVHVEDSSRLTVKKDN